MNASSPRAVVIGASAGAIQALSEILPALPEDYLLSILIVVHIPAERDNILAPLFQSKCRLDVREAEDKEPILPGIIYFAPPDYHMLVEADETISLSSDEPVLHSRPSIDVLFESAAYAFGPGLIGIILTGANADGAQGLKMVEEAGGTVIVEDPALAYADAMPLAALKACSAAKPMSHDMITHYLMKAGSR